MALLADSFAIHYIIGGVSNLSKRLKIKHKSGRLINIRQQPDSPERRNNEDAPKKHPF